ncbi:MAG: GNAT family N-acetyltransferase [Clostridia bacterium]
MENDMDIFRKYKINIRKVKKEDLRAVAEIAVNGWKTAYRGIIDDVFLDNLSIEENYQKRLNDYTENGFIVAELNNEIVGFCRYRTGNYYKDKYADADCEICALYVKPNCKRNGIGKKLVNYVINEFKENGYAKMILWCLKDNYPSRTFYDKLGGIYCGENVIERGNKEYKEVGYIYNLKKLPKDELELVIPTKEYKKQVEEYLQEFLDNGEYEIAGDGGLDRIKNFDEWLRKVQNDLSEENIEDNRIPATLYLTVRKSDNKIVGNLQIRHKLNEALLNYGGHIGDSVRPSERRKGYATEQIRLALEECKKLGIDNVLMDCDKNNIESAKSIQNNGGILENEIYVENELIQRYWISLKKRFATNPNNMEIVQEGNLKIRNFNNSDFQGDIALIKFNKMYKPYMIENINLCMANDNYKWLEFYDYNKKYRLTTMYNEKNEIVEWYFDIARKIGNENGIPYEDDLYLDVVVTPIGEIILLDEDELKEALDRMEITALEYESAYKEAEELMERLKGRKDELQEFTNKYLKIMMGDE